MEPEKPGSKWRMAHEKVVSVEEGFAQGCPASPVSAVIVLNDILTNIQPELER